MLQATMSSRRESETLMLVLNVSEPPSLWHELSGSIRSSILPTRNRPSSLTQWIVSVIYGLFPIVHWARNYNLKSFKSDLIAGLTLASLGIPQSIGYANLAKLDPQYGLYTSFVPPLIYAVMGSSRDIAIGPVAVVSLLLSSMTQKIVDPLADPTTYRNLVLTSTFFAGIFQVSFGFFRLGFVVDFLSHATIVGFMGGAAIVIGLQQLKGLLGISHFTNNTDIVSVIRAVWVALHHNWHPDNFLIGCSFLIFILFVRFIGVRKRKLFWLAATTPLLSVILSTLLVYLTRADKHGVKIIQQVKEGLNPSSVKQIQLTGSHVGESAKIGLICAIIALTEAIAVGRSFAAVKGYQLDGNKEMVAMGFMNIAGSLSSCYVATGSFSRTAVNVSAGCVTAVSNIIMAITVLISLEVLMKLLYYTPIAILASIILSALPGLINFKEAYIIWKVDKMDFLACFGAFAGVLFGSVEIGLLTAVIISFARIIIRALRPNIEMLGRIEGTNIYCNMKQYPFAITTPNLLIIRIDSPFLCFINANFIRERIIAWVTEGHDAIKEKTGIEVTSVIIDMSNVLNIDTSGISAIEELHKKLVSACVQVAVVNPGWEVIHKMKLSRLVDKIGARIFLTVSEAVEALASSAMKQENSDIV
ncbi:low affinity sulfate transporter 3-like [Zingiber officinale]|uniref:low affinity sulfate transporter 3-like n=1 Tax=Zingiber officinale TaxID=94328 RepID=UPI001C4DCFD2|nr:low affinity sulfate transporter 3-like [Zingiber officinale]XP_042379561.1 low affinity sulfate transporter 3-like [Zingiber officinale]